MNRLLGRTNKGPEAYNGDGTMPLLAPENKIVVSFDALGEKYNGKYRITAEKGGKTAEYVVDPNAPSVNKAVVEAIVSKLNGGEEKVAGPPEPPGPPTEPTPELQALNAAVDELIAGITDSGKINTATDKITTATGAITVADKDAAISKVTEAIAAVDKALTPVTGAAPASESLIPVLENAKKALLAANETLNKLVELAPPAPAGGYNSAKSAVPKRITRMRRTRRSTKLAGTRRRRRLTR